MRDSSAPTTLRTSSQIRKLLPQLRPKELLKIKKDGKKSSRKKPSKPFQIVTSDKNFSVKMSKTDRNKQRRRRLQLNIERKVKIERKRNADIENVEKYSSLLGETQISMKRKQITIAKRKLEAFKTKHLGQRFLTVPSSSIWKNLTPGSFRSLKPFGNEIKERVVQYERRNMVV